MLSTKEAMARLIDQSGGLVAVKVDKPLPKRVIMRCFMPCCEACGTCHHHQTCEEFKAGVCRLKGMKP